MEENTQRDIDRLYDHANVANKEMGIIKESIGVIKRTQGVIENDICWIKRKVDKLDGRIWWILGTVIVGVLLIIVEILTNIM